ncbi:GNAT family N-acetyltransferase [Phytoactinopolyspora halotolerans]|uniref:Lysine N-acyltransferase MbtK n=1 Tax=Phytoactinopolyspora halotolerans TaxID=1981512 RepID=A0A6L9SGW2_9ACTN|nr:GNAT family N-acetyltransferase [Phytoactinopolyspora halotolerans]NEE03864.1 acetyltransferase [Phytoactinopolyspora halotolerans]
MNARTTPRPWSAVYGREAPGGGPGPVRIDVAPVDIERHGALIHGWMNRPHVAPWWELDKPLEDVCAYLDGLTHLQPWVVSADGEPFGYVETYRVGEDALAAYYPVRPTDVGWHLLVGPERFLGSGIPRLLGRAFLAFQLGLPTAKTGDDARPHRGDRVVCEPDIRNTRMHAFCRSLGFHSIGEVDLPDKRALLMVCAREDAVRHGARP